ncbi:uncharacterized protein V6R79_010525 [Siganus canaliculatus]
MQLMARVHSTCRRLIRLLLSITAGLAPLEQGRGRGGLWSPARTAEVHGDLTLRRNSLRQKYLIRDTVCEEWSSLSQSDSGADESTTEFPLSCTLKVRTALSCWSRSSCFSSVDVSDVEGGCDLLPTLQETSKSCSSMTVQDPLLHATVNLKPPCHNPQPAGEQSASGYRPNAKHVSCQGGNRLTQTLLLFTTETFSPLE